MEDIRIPFSNRRSDNEEQSFARKLKAAAMLLESCLHSSRRSGSNTSFGHHHRAHDPLFTIEHPPNISNPSARLYIRNFSHDATLDDVRNHFGTYGELKEIKMMDGLGFVEYANAKSTSAALLALHETQFIGERLEINSYNQLFVRLRLRPPMSCDRSAEQLSFDSSASIDSDENTSEFTPTDEELNVFRNHTKVACASEMAELDESRLQPKVRVCQTGNTFNPSSCANPIPGSFNTMVGQKVPSVSTQITFEQQQSQYVVGKKRKADCEMNLSGLSIRMDRRPMSTIRAPGKNLLSPSATWHHTISEDCSTNDAQRQRARFMALERSFSIRT